MYPSPSDSNRSVGELLAWLRQTHLPSSAEFYKALRTSSSTYLKIERDQRELSLLMALRLCQFYKLDLHEFIAMLGDQELDRADRSVIKAKEKRERKKAQVSQATVIDISTSKVIPEAGR